MNISTDSDHPKIVEKHWHKSITIRLSTSSEKEKKKRKAYQESLKKIESEFKFNKR